MKDSLVGHQVGHYHLLELIDGGAMARVYRARHTAAGHEVAIKVLRAEASAHDRSARRFGREAMLMASLRIPGVPDVYDTGVLEDGRCYLVMELVQGESLASRLKRLGPLPVREALRLALSVSKTISALHHNGIIHRDLKPANVLVAKGAAEGDAAGLITWRPSSGMVRRRLDRRPMSMRSGACCSKCYVAGRPLLATRLG